MRFLIDFFQKKNDFNISNVDLARNFLFIHVPKNAGTSMIQHLGLKESSHKTVKEYIEIFGKARFSKLNTIAIVRNPFDRFISLYNYARMPISFYHNNINPSEAIFGKHLDYELLKNATIDEAVNFLRDNKLSHNPPHIQWFPQAFWLKDNEDNINVKLLARFENLDAYLPRIFELTKQPIAFEEIKKVNSSSKTRINYRDVLSDSSKKILEEYYREDLELFNYTF